jgi:uncharacterized protein (TIGR02145 family)
MKNYIIILCLLAACSGPAEKDRPEAKYAITQALNDQDMINNKSVSDKVKPISDSAVTSLWKDMLLHADSAIIPAGFSRNKNDTHEPEKTESNDEASKADKMSQGGIIIDSKIIRTAQPLRVGARPIDNVLTKGQNHWYVLYAEDGIGFIRIGATGPILIDGAPYKAGQGWGPGGSCSSYDGPQRGADLIEISEISITEQALIWGVKTAFLNVHTTSTVPVSYRISFVSELPENRTGFPPVYGPGVAANEYIMAVANGNTTDLYRATRTHFTTEQVNKLRRKLFGTEDQINFTCQYQKPAEGMLPVQHIILSAENSTAEGRHWAFEIVCVQQDGLWLVSDAKRDSDLLDSHVMDIIKAILRRALAVSTCLFQGSSCTVKDADGNVYKTVKIGNQVWTTENLRTTKYNDNTPIPLDTSKASWAYATTAKYCYYNNTTNADSIKKFGALYNWFAVDTKKLAPDGWHVPTDDDWKILVFYLAGKDFDYYDSISVNECRNEIAKILAAKTDWITNSYFGTIGCDLSKNNSSGFSALPGGYRGNNGNFSNIGKIGHWWSTTEVMVDTSRKYQNYPDTADHTVHAYHRSLEFNYGALVRYIYSKSFGFSVRLIKD